MKIIYYSPHPHLNLMSHAGYATHMREMITAFRNIGCEVMPVIMGGEENPPEESLNQNAAAPKAFIKKVIPKNIWRTLKDIDLLRFDHKNGIKRLEDALAEFDADCIYERCNYLQLSGIKIARKYDLYHVMEINSPYVDQMKDMANSRSFLEKYARYVEKKQVEQTDVPLAVVGPLKDYFVERYNVNADKFLITHDAFSKDNIQLDAGNQQKIMEQYDLSGKTIIGYIGSIFEWHGLDKMIKAFDSLDLPDTKLFIVGYGAYMVNLIDLTKKLGREKDIIFTGRVPREQIFDHINIMDVCVAPNAAWYQSPVKIFEYGAMGKPILGPDTAAVNEIMEPDKDGILVKPTVEEVKEGLMKLLNNPGQATIMGQHFQEKVLNDYTWDKNAKKVLSKVEKVS